MLNSSEASIPRSYPVTALATFLLVSICIWTFSFVVDPYDLFPQLPRVSSEKSPDLFYHLRLHKPYAIERIKPQILIAGSSRASGLPPQPFDTSGSVAYNAALPRASLRDIRWLVEHAQAITPQKILLVSVDHPMFWEGYSDPMPLDEINRYRKLNPSLRERLAHHYQQLVDVWRSLYSVDALLDSWRLLSGKRRSQSEYHEDGTWEMGIHNALSPSWLYAALVKQVHSDELASEPGSFTFDELTELLDFTDANGIRVILLIAPMQGLLMQTVNVAGHWEDYLNWQRELVALVDARDTDTEVVGVEDKPRLVLEKIDAPDPLFRDGIHYTRKAGVEIVSCLAGPCESNLDPTVLNSDSIDAYLQRVDALRMQYVRENPADLARMHEWLKVNSNRDSEG